LSIVGITPALLVSNHRPFTLFGGVNVLESQNLVLRVAEKFVQITQRQGIRYVFKGSFDKVNRSSIHSYRGSHLDEG
jgi:2-dehydro-3-deoxyphosphooctonate aldolase (KDO 8-P synthase)